MGGINSNKQIKTSVGPISDSFIGSFNAGNFPEHSLTARIRAIEQHFHQKSFIYPDKADAIELTAPAPAWTESSFIEIIPANSVANPFDIHFGIVSDISANGQYQVDLYSGLEGEEILLNSLTFARSTNKSQEAYVPAQGRVLPANTRVIAKISCSATRQQTCGFKVYYHDYTY